MYIEYEKDERKGVADAREGFSGRLLTTRSSTKR